MEGEWEGKVGMVNKTILYGKSESMPINDAILKEENDHFWEYIWRKWNQDLEEIPAVQCSLYIIHNIQDMEAT